MKKIFFLSILSVLFCACSPVITKQIYKTYLPDTNDTVTVYELDQPVGSRYENLGTFKIENSEFSPLSSYAKVLNYAKEESRKIGGNAIKIIEHVKPHTEMAGLGVVFTTRHDIVFMAIKLSNTKLLSDSLTNDTIKKPDNYAHLNFYEQKTVYSGYRRPDMIELMIYRMGYGYQILLDDSLVVKMGKDWKKAVVNTEKTGHHSIKAKVKQGNFEIPLDIEIGKEYFIRSRYTISGRRVFELVDNQLGEFEFSIVK